MLVVIAHTEHGGVVRCVLRLTGATAAAAARELSREAAYAVPGFRRGRAGLRALWRTHRGGVEARLLKWIEELAVRKLGGLLEQAALPPRYRLLQLLADGAVEAELTLFRRPQAPDPRGAGGELAGAPPGDGVLQLPSGGVRNYQALLPQVVRRLPQLQHFRLGQAEERGGALQRGPVVPPPPRSMQPAAPGAGGSAGVERSVPAPTLPVPALPAVELPAGVGV